MAGAQTLSKYGAKVFLDQCPKCGGLWFDGDELYLAKPTADENYTELDIDSLAGTAVLPDHPLKCPREGAVLKAFSDPMLSESLHFESCPQCGGFWFNHGEFRQFQDEREKKQAEFAQEETRSGVEHNDELQKQIERLLVANGEGSSYDTLGKLGDFLLTPMQACGGAKYYQPEKNQEKWAGIVTEAVSALLRMFLR